MDIKAVQKICKDFEAKNGKGSVFQLGSDKTRLQIPKWTSGIEDLDEILGGGVPYGRVIELFGTESSGKTSLTFWLMRMVKHGAYIPIEGTYDESRAFAIGVQPKQMTIFNAEYGEQVIDLIIGLAKAGMPLIAVDSVPACQPEKESVKIENNTNKKMVMGAIAQLFNDYMPIIRRRCEASGSTLILVNQLRDTVDAAMFGEKDHTPGGRAIKFYSSIRLKVARRSWIEIPNKNPRISSDDVKVGFVMKARVVKNKVANPYGEAEIPFFFDRGFVSYDDIKPIRKELMKKSGIKERKEEDDDE